MIYAIYIASLLLSLLATNDNSAMHRPSYTKSKTIHDAAHQGDVDAAREILDRNRALINSYDSFGGTPLHTAAFKGHGHMIEFLISRNADIQAINKKYGVTPLHLAARLNHSAAAEALLTLGAQIDSTDRLGNTPLTLAALEGHYSVAQLLIDHKAHVDHEDKVGTTPLMLAASQGHYSVAQLLIDHKAQVDHEDKDGETSLILAALQGHYSVAQLLIDHKAQVDHEDKDGKTPLMLAALQGHERIIQLLIEHGADVNSVNKMGGTALAAARAKGHTSIIKILEQHHAAEGTIFSKKVSPSTPSKFSADTAPFMPTAAISSLIQAMAITQAESTDQVTERRPNVIQQVIKQAAQPFPVLIASVSPLAQAVTHVGQADQKTHVDDKKLVAYRGIVDFQPHIPTPSSLENSSRTKKRAKKKNGTQQDAAHLLMHALEHDKTSHPLRTVLDDAPSTSWDDGEQPAETTEFLHTTEPQYSCSQLIKAKLRALCAGLKYKLHMM